MLQHLTRSAFLLLACVSMALSAKQVEVFIAVPIERPYLSDYKETLDQTRRDVLNSVRSAGADFQKATEYHITLKHVQNVNFKDVQKYYDVVRNLARQLTAFDLTKQIRQAEYDITTNSKGREVAILRVPLFYKDPLSNLRDALESQLKAKNLPGGNVSIFNAHISLGTAESTILTELTAPKLDINDAPFSKLTRPFMVKEIWFKVSEKVMDPQTGKPFFKLISSEFIPLKSQPKLESAAADRAPRQPLRSIQIAQQTHTTQVAPAFQPLSQTSLKPIESGKPVEKAQSERNASWSSMLSTFFAKLWGK